jgi:hypothetical protein
LVSSIRDYTFSGCNNLISIEFPPALESIGDYAFYNCISLSSIKIGTTTPPGLSVDVFYLVDKTKCLLYVPIGSLSAYKEADQWKDFLTILEFDPAGISKVNCPIIAIYPNPTQTHVTIELGEASINARLILYNSLGQTVYECQTANERMSLDVSRFPAGTYVVNVKGNGNQKQWVGKFIKEYSIVGSHTGSHLWGYCPDAESDRNEPVLSYDSIRIHPYSRCQNSGIFSGVLASFFCLTKQEYILSKKVKFLLVIVLLLRIFALSKIEYGKI